MTATRERALIAHLLGDAPASPALRRWFATIEGRRAVAAYRRLLRAVDAWGARAAGAGARSRRSRRHATAATTPNVVYVDRVATPLGAVLAAVSDRGLVGVSFGRAVEAFGATLARRHRTSVVRSERRLAPVRRQLAEYLSGTRRRFDLPVDLRGVSPFQRRVLAAARRIPRGRVASYGEIARRIGQPGASRAVGQALGRNPIPIVIPCHRVVAGGGKLGGYVGGATRKRSLLTLEESLRATGT